MTSRSRDSWHSPIRSWTSLYPFNPSTDQEEEEALSTPIIPLPRKLLSRVPDECWCLILSFLPPAHLARKTLVSKRWKEMIERDLAPTWRVLADQCHLGEPRNRIKTYQELVLGHTLLICEVCLECSSRFRNPNDGNSARNRKGGVGSDLPLPVWRKDALGCTWMCRPCRRRYFEQHPEPSRQSQPSDYPLHQRGLSMYQMCSVPMDLRSMIGTAVPSSSAPSPTGVQPTETKATTMEDGSTMNPNPAPAQQQNQQHHREEHETRRGILPVIPLDTPFLLQQPIEKIGQGIVMEARRQHGGDIGIEAHHLESRISHLLRRRRRKLITTLLGLLGIRLRNDSKLCGRFIAGSMDCPFRIAEVMKEMAWYYDATCYIEYMESDYDSIGAKISALTEWVQDTLELFGHEKAKEAYKRPISKENLPTTTTTTTTTQDEPVFELQGGVIIRVEREPPPQSLWPLLDTWLDHYLRGEHDYRPPSSLFELDCEIDDAD
ncbi:MAG: hypothetical protein J3Q66DRAFT_320462 [Benniella sp.]|nr:MAG: hypothetical protein J3Q66DRAFT_320462 [Benniella sp.]